MPLRPTVGMTKRHYVSRLIHQLSVHSHLFCVKWYLRT